MTVDYIVVGVGLAGISFCEQLRKHDKSFVVFDNSSQQSSIVAGGLYNPVVLKRFTPVWKSDEQLQKALPMYHGIEENLKVKLDYKIPVYRKFTSLEEQNNWFAASDNPLLSRYLSLNIIKNNNKAIEAPFGYGEVLHTGRINVKQLVEAYKEDLKEKGMLFNNVFNHDDLEVKEGGIQYETVKAKHIVFAEGYGLARNPFFNQLPLMATKGELLVIHAPDLEIDYVLKSSVFLIPLGKDMYIVGATYEWSDKTNTVTNKAKEELLSKLEKVISCSYNVVNQVAGIRPTVIDRRPLVGVHPKHKNLFVLNGLGTRGVMIAPYVAEQLFNFIEHGKPLEKDIDITRF
ncbi:NAD(P)/FAD-dependent oxidoreductase [Snuella sedimenti]|uniref:FAD-binding oxidoreductase n=1 Tax=Snuella sedimenti TaxID=2798802 RepID=A0A8J7IGY0_9FLAO|nr:FAD-binding oxidoreductase [Snuella sedimenti]MBJ6368043.1 FAD-binding oxidoreductase [Snuella sedimenti]